MNRKNMDELFREKLKDFREMPDERVWKSIENSLDKRKKRRVIPIWWKLGGVAAVLLIALLAINPFGSVDMPDNPITDTEEAAPVLDDTNSIDGPQEGENEAVNPDNPLAGSTLNETDSTSDEVKSGSEDEQKSKKDSYQISGGNVLAGTDEQRSPSAPAGSEDSMDQREGLVEGLPAVTRNAPARSVDEKERVGAEQEAYAVNEERPADAAKEEELKDGIAETAVAGETKDNKAEIPDETGKKSIFDEIDKEEEALVESSGSKWSVGPTVAPVYFNTFGEGSSIHSNFVSNSKSGNVNLSYGVAVSYEISDKLSLRSGLHKVDYGYDTNDITFSSSLVASTSTQITNINYTNTSRNLVVESTNAPVNPSEFVANDIVAQTPSRSGRMVQQFGYLEVPMELNYSLFDSRFNIDLIGGVSSLFLVNNNVTLESSGTSTEMGEANNLNDVNFSTNVGLGINYELNDKMKVHLEPMFKYQLNTFSETEGNFQPYSLGVYTGMSFKF